jgi:hypothetical protein
MKKKKKDNLKNWKKLSKPPEEALKKITGGRLSGKIDINPQWRIKVMTEVYGTCGIGWKFKIKKLWKEEGAKELMCFAKVNLYIKEKESWSEPIQGVGGSKLIQLEKGGLYNNDEGYKMAITDALSVAMKFLGVASEVYEGIYDTKYSNTNEIRQNQTQKEMDFTKELTGEEEVCKKCGAKLEISKKGNKYCKCWFKN